MLWGHSKIQNLEESLNKSERRCHDLEAKIQQLEADNRLLQEQVTRQTQQHTKEETIHNLIELLFSSCTQNLPVIQRDFLLRLNSFNIFRQHHSHHHATLMKALWEL